MLWLPNRSSDDGMQANLDRISEQFPVTGITSLLNNVSGTLPVSTTFEVTRELEARQCAFLWWGSGFIEAGQALAQYNLRLSIDEVVVNTITFFFNTRLVHTLMGVSYFVTRLESGRHRVRIDTSTEVRADNQDRFSVLLIRFN